jgi:hypothetical protein
VCHPVNDHLIERLIDEGRLTVDGTGRGRMFLRDISRDGRWREVGQEHKAQQAGKRPAAPLYRQFSVKVSGNVRTLRVNRVIYVAYFGPTLLEVDHVDDDSLNCGLENLHGKTRAENQHKAMEAKWLRSQPAYEGGVSSATSVLEDDCIPF